MSAAQGEAPAPHAYPDPVTRRLITMSVMAATIMSALDTTIANVALPHMQGSVGAAQDEITWVLTSYIVASAIFIPLCGWLADKFGRKRLMIISVVGFTVASMLCGLATNLPELVGFRVMQGIFGAALVPMSQSILLDINPPERHGPAMAIYGMGAILGPIVGPMLGGYLTDNFSWRWVFYVNVPVGVLSAIGLSTFLSESKVAGKAKLDLFGFLLLAMAIGLFQLVLDRGQQQDWLSSTEICIEAALSLFCLYMFIVHSATAKNPFISLALFKDSNFVFACLFGLMLGVMLYSVLALLPTMLEGLMGYPVMLTGLVTAPRGVATLISMTAVGFLIKRVDPRLLLLAGFMLSGLAMYLMAGFSLAMGSDIVLISGFINGLGNGLIFVPLSTMAFATISKVYRNEAASIFTLIRNLGSAVGISLMQTLIVRDSAQVHARLVQGVRPDNPLLDLRMPGFDFQSASAVARMNGEITRQAAMVSYVDGYWVMLGLTVVTIPFILFMRPRRADPNEPAINVHFD